MNKRVLFSYFAVVLFCCMSVSVASACEDYDGDRYYPESCGDVKILGSKGFEPDECNGGADGLIDCTANPEICNPAMVRDTMLNVGKGSDVKIHGNRIHPGAIEVPDNGVDENCDGKEGDFLAGKESVDLNTWIQKIIGILSGIVGSVSVAVLIWGGIMFATAAGNDDKTRKAKKTMVGAVIGLVVAMSAWTIIGFVVDSFV